MQVRVSRPRASFDVDLGPDHTEVKEGSCRLKLMGHAGGNINEKVYTHKTIDELREAVEMIKVP